ncbi:hypothetical protein [Pseudomonas fulva]|uniref:hypothetical protein n=1 Tax=Pseudomonas fulva TaxID=47880 RepID=UPI0034CD72BB
MKFLDSIREGVAKAEASDRHVKEVAMLFKELNLELSSYEGAGLRIVRRISTIAKIAEVSSYISDGKVVNEYFAADRLVLADADGKRSFAEIAKWRQHINGFPCIISFEGQDFICDNIDDLKSAIQELLSTVSFGKSLSKAITEIRASPGESPALGNNE